MVTLLLLIFLRTVTLAYFEKWLKMFAIANCEKQLFQKEIVSGFKVSKFRVSFLWMDWEEMKDFTVERLGMAAISNCSDLK